MGILGDYRASSRWLSRGNYHSGIFDAKPVSTLVHKQLVLLVTGDSWPQCLGSGWATGGGLSAPLPQEMRVTLELGVEEVTVPFGSCHQDLGGETGLGHL